MAADLTLLPLSATTVGAYVSEKRLQSARNTLDDLQTKQEEKFYRFDSTPAMGLEDQITEQEEIIFEEKRNRAKLALIAIPSTLYAATRGITKGGEIIKKLIPHQ